MKTPSARPSFRTPLVILLLGAAVVVWIQNAELNFKPHFTALTILLTTLLVVFWTILSSRLSLGRRLGLLALVAAVLAGAGWFIKTFTRVDSTYSGMSLPRLVWKWTPKPDMQLHGVEVVSTNVPLPAANPAKGMLQDSPEFLGPGRSNTLASLSLERDWAKHPPEELWRQPIGAGWAGWAVAGHRAVTQEQRGEHELVVCYDLFTGKPLWAHTNEVRFSEALGGDGPRATPTIAGDRVFALGATGILDCLELSSGRSLWSRPTLSEAKSENLMWGKSSSPLVVGELVVVSGGETAPSLLAYDRATGTPAWQRGSDRSSYASPVLASLAGRSQILTVNAGSVAGHDAADGRVLWTYAWPGNFPKCSQPVPLPPDRVFISAGYNVGSALLRLKAGDGGAPGVEEIWRKRVMKTQFANVAVLGGFVYGLDEGILLCTALESGERQWKDGRYGHGQLLLAKDLLVIQTEPGPVVLVEANPKEFREVARYPALSSKTWNQPTLAGQFLLVRNDREAVCLKLPLAK